MEVIKNVAIVDGKVSDVMMLAANLSSCGKRITPLLTPLLTLLLTPL